MNPHLDSEIKSLLETYSRIISEDELYKMYSAYETGKARAKGKAAKGKIDPFSNDALYFIPFTGWATIWLDSGMFADIIALDRII